LDKHIELDIFILNSKTFRKYWPFI